MELRLKKTAMAALVPFAMGFCAQAHAADKPNIVVIMGDDIGISNIAIYNHGLMGYKTPNIDRIATEGALFTDYYGQQSSTAGRAAFITGQSPIRTGLTKVGLPGAKEGLSPKDPTLADILKNRAMQRASSARITWAIATSSCLPCTALMSSLAIFITSTPRKSRRMPTIQRIPSSRLNSVQGVYSSALQRLATTEPKTRASANGGSRNARTLAH
jgi:hypothetical protein